MTAITGSNGNDLLTGTAGNDTINSGNGDDTVNGGAGSDSLNGGAGDDTLDGGSGSDQLNGGSGNDTLIYNVSENAAAGTKDVYTGGAGVDTLLLQFTRAQWLDSRVCVRRRWSRKWYLKIPITICWWVRARRISRATWDSKLKKT